MAGIGDLLAGHPESRGDFGVDEFSGGRLFGEPVSEVGARDFVDGDDFGIVAATGVFFRQAGGFEEGDQLVGQASGGGTGLKFSHARGGVAGFFQQLAASGSLKRFEF